MSISGFHCLKVIVILYPPKLKVTKNKLVMINFLETHANCVRTFGQDVNRRSPFSPSPSLSLRHETRQRCGDLECHIAQVSLTYAMTPVWEVLPDYTILGGWRDPKRSLSRNKGFRLGGRNGTSFPIQNSLFRNIEHNPRPPAVHCLLSNRFLVVYFDINQCPPGLTLEKANTQTV